MLLVGLTGGIGAGKSTVSELLAARGATIVDADVVARAVVEPGEPALDQLVEHFGPGVLGPDGRLDRPALAKVAFVDEESRKALEAITHPAINTEFARRIGEAPPDAVVICDVPLLAESEQARARGLSRADAEARMAAQATDEQRRTLATYVVDNGGDRAHLERQIDEIWTDLERRRAEQDSAKSGQE
jgi:dephospho-CoA kinase